MNKNILLEDIKEILDKLESNFCDNPQLFLDEAEIKNTLFRLLLESLIFTNKYPHLYIEKEYQISSKPIRKYDIAIYEGEDKLLVAFELKFTQSDIDYLFKSLEEDIIRLEKYSGKSCIKSYILFYNNFELYPQEILEKIKNLEHNEKIEIRICNPSKEKIGIIQKKYMWYYTPTFSIKQSPEIDKKNQHP